MPDTPVVSVVIPTRNCLRWLPAAITSVGPEPAAEIIVFDDGSTDGTGAWLAEAARADPRIRVLTGSGIGPSRARNCAVEAARAPLIAFLDADDRWYPNKLAVQLALHRAYPEAAFSFTNYRHVTDDGGDRGTCFGYWPRFAARMRGLTTPFALGGDALAQIYAENIVGTSTVVARADFVRGVGAFAADLPSSEDWDLWLKLAKKGPVMCVPSVLVDYLMHRPGNMTGNLRARVLAMRIIGARHEDAARQADRSAIRCLAARISAADAEIAAIAGEAWRAIRLRARAFLHMPSRQAGWELLAATGHALGLRNGP